MRSTAARVLRKLLRSCMALKAAWMTVALAVSRLPRAPCSPSRCRIKHLC